MEKIAILTDTVANLPKGYIEENNIYTLPLYVCIDDKHYKENIEIDTKKLIKLREKKQVRAKSSAPSPSDFRKIYEKIKEDGFNKVLVITLTSNMSNTFNAASLEKIDGLDIRVIDSNAASIAEGFMVIYAKNLLDKGLSFDEIVKKVEEKRENKEIYLWIDSISYLKDGGRLGTLGKKITSVINLKPILKLNSKGEFELIKLKKNEEKSKDIVVDKVREKLKDAKSYYLGYFYVGDKKILEKVKEKSQDIIDKAKIVVEGEISPVVAVHLGNKSYICAYFIEE